MKTNSLLNIIPLVLLISVFLFTPFSEFKRMYIIGALLVLWFFSSFILNRKAIRDTIPLIVVLFLIMIIQAIYSSSPGNEDEFRRFFTQFLLTYIWGVIGVFYASNTDLFKMSIPFIIGMIAISSVYTIIGNIAIPNASRLLAGSEQEGSSMYYLIRSMHIGGYDFIYALVFLLFPSVLWFKYKLSRPFFPVLFLLLILATLVVGSYFTSIIMATVVVILTLSNTRRMTTSFLVFCLLTLIVFLFKDILLQWLINFGEVIDSHMLQMRAQELLDGTYQENAESMGQYSRIDRMLNAIHNISQSPLIGRMTPQKLEILPSGHSELLGYFERYGLFGFLYIYYYYLIYKKIAKRVVTTEMKRYVTILFVLFFVFIFINTFDVANATGCVVFFIAPCALLYIERRSNQQRILNKV